MPISDYLKSLRGKIGRDLILLPSVAAVIRSRSGKILLQGKADDVWSLPAGAIEPGETPADAIVREVREETGLIVRPTRIAGIFGGENFRYTYSNGDAVEYTIVLFECEVVGGNLAALDDETVKLEYFAPESLPPLPIKYPPELFIQPSRTTYFESNEKRPEEFE